MALTLFNDFLFPSVFDHPRKRSFDRAFGIALAPRGTGDMMRTLERNLHAFDVVESKDKYELVADAPGMTPEEVKIELNEGVLSISGSHSHEKKEEKEAVAAEKEGAGAVRKQEGGRKVLRSERTSYHFSRTFVLPDNADPEAISAGLDKGVLRVSIHKRPEPPKPEPKRIAVNAH